MHVVVCIGSDDEWRCWRGKWCSKSTPSHNGEIGFELKSDLSQIRSAPAQDENSWLAFVSKGVLIFLSSAVIEINSLQSSGCCCQTHWVMLSRNNLHFRWMDLFSQKPSCTWAGHAGTIASKISGLNKKLVLLWQPWTKKTHSWISTDTPKHDNSWLICFYSFFSGLYKIDWLETSVVFFLLTFWFCISINQLLFLYNGHALLRHEAKGTKLANAI